MLLSWVTSLGIGAVFVPQLRASPPEIDQCDHHSVEPPSITRVTSISFVSSRLPERKQISRASRGRISAAAAVVLYVFSV